MFSKEDIQTAVKPRSTSLIGRETPIKTTMQHLSEWPSSKDKSAGESAEKGALPRRWRECKLVQPPGRTVCKFLQK